MRTLQRKGACTERRINIVSNLISKKSNFYLTGGGSYHTDCSQNQFRTKPEQTQIILALTAHRNVMAEPSCVSSAGQCPDGGVRGVATHLRAIAPRPQVIRDACNEGVRGLCGGHLRPIRGADPPEPFKASANGHPPIGRKWSPPSVLWCSALVWHSGTLEVRGSYKPVF